MSEKTPVPARPPLSRGDQAGPATARQTRLHAERLGVRVRASLEEVADDHSRAAMELVIGV